MNHLKEQLAVYKTTDSTEYIKNEIRQNLNTINSIER